MAGIAAEFRWPVRVYYEDTDNGGVVYYANYLKFMERARTEWLRSLGLEQDKLIKEQGVIFAVRSAQVDYLRPARFNQMLSVSAEVIETGKASMTFNQEVSVINTISVSNNNMMEETVTKGMEGDPATAGELLCRGQIRIACLDAETMKPCAIPELVLEEILGDR
ncbi:tol-pal system-associated acyl-CoA thioesterase [Kaarinaea lacus]